VYYSIAESSKLCIFTFITTFVGHDFLFPPPLVSSGARKAAWAAVPKAAIDENRKVFVLDKKI